eukprot:1158867-Pelagomonas_calceolata.AAC.5
MRIIAFRGEAHHGLMSRSITQQASNELRISSAGKKSHTRAGMVNIYIGQRLQQINKHEFSLFLHHGHNHNPWQSPNTPKIGGTYGKGGIRGVCER